MVLCVVVLTMLFFRAVRRRAQIWDAAATRPRSGAAYAMVSLVLWVAIIFCGRFIGYTWAFYI